MNLERNKPAKESIEIAIKYLNYFGIDFSINRYNTQNNTVTVSKIINNTTKEIISAGKGLGSQGLASGLFEAIEHHMYFNILRNNDSKKMKMIDIANSHKRLVESYPIQYLTRHYRDEIFPAITFQSIINPRKKIFLPSFLVVPEEKIYDENLEKLTKYKSNNGLAVGISKEEALIHSINEVIERDSLSKHLISYFLKKSQVVHFIDKNTLSSKLFTILSDIELTIRNKINIIDVTHIPGFYSFYVFTNIDDKPLPLKGSGTSFNPNYALERALSELFQAFKMYDEADFIQDEVTKTSFSDFEILSDLIKCKYNMKDLEMKSFPIDTNPNVDSLDEMLNLMIDKLKEHNLNVYCNYIYKAENLFCLITYIPGTENFQMINNGVYTLPNDYGWS